MPFFFACGTFTLGQVLNANADANDRQSSDLVHARNWNQHDWFIALESLFLSILVDTA